MATKQMGTVRKLPSGRFQAFYRVDGDTFTAPSTFTTKTDARDWLAAERADRARGTWSNPKAGRVTLAEYLADWLESRQNLAPSTRDLYAEKIARWIVPPLAGDDGRTMCLGKLELHDLTPAHVRRWFAVLSQAARRSALTRSKRSGRAEHPARVWGREHGHDVQTTGRMSPALLAGWEAAGRPEPALTARGGDPGRTAAAQAYRVLRAAMNDAVRDRLIPETPCVVAGAGVTRPRERGTASPAEVVALAKAMPAHLRAAVVVAAWSGLRFGELFALARRHVDITTGTIRVDRALSKGDSLDGFGPPKTAGSVRTVTLPRFVVTALADHMARYTRPEPDALVFATRTGQPVDDRSLTTMFARARHAIGRDDLTWHDLRHTGATLAYRAGASVKDVQRRLGHTTARAAMIYAHAADDSDKVLADRLDAAFGDENNVVPMLGRSA
jgi:integrase